MRKSPLRRGASDWFPSVAFRERGYCSCDRGRYLVAGIITDEDNKGEVKVEKRELTEKENKSQRRGK